MQRLRRGGFGREMGVYAVLVFLYALLAAREPSFRGWDNARNVLTQISLVAVVGVGMTAVILSGGIDLSVGSVAAFASCVSGILVTRHGWSAGSGIAAALGIGALLGAFNGFSITWVGLPPFISTLATMVMARGLAFVVSGGATVYNLPSAFLWPGSGNLFRRFPLIGKLPFMIAATALLYAGGHAILRGTRMGRYVYAIGGNHEASRLSGVPTRQVVISCYVATGLLAAFAGLLTTGYVGAAEPTMADGMELDVIAAAVIGGTSLSGGVGTMGGTLAGALMIGLVRNGLNLMQVNSNWQKVVIGAIIYFAVMFDVVQRRRSTV